MVMAGFRFSLTRVSRLSLMDWCDLAVAVSELAIARVKLGRSSVEELLKEQAPKYPASGRHAERVRRVQIAIARAHHRLPWRADCLVQALAAHRWLCRYGIATKLLVGSIGNMQQPFKAHAWLTHEGLAVTGGDAREYTPLKPVGIRDH
jgi:hypothetical protein